MCTNTYGNICDFNDLNLLKKNYNFLFLKMPNLWVQQLMGSNQEQIQILVHLVFMLTKTITTGEGGLIM